MSRKQTKKQSQQPYTAAYIKIPEVGLANPITEKVRFSIAWSKKKTYLNPNREISTAVRVLLERLFENENLLGWDSTEELNTDIDEAIALLKRLKNDP